jgi:WD40 repeat protein
VADPAHPTPLGQPLTGATDVVGSVAFSPDGHTLVAGSADKTVQIWTLPDPDQPPTVNEQLSGHNGSVTTVAFSPDGHAMATGSDDETVQLWSLDLGDAIQRICATTRDVLTPQQWQQQLPQLPYAPPCG